MSERDPDQIPEEELPDKPAAEEQLPEEGDQVSQDELEQADEGVPDEEFLPESEAEADDTVDNQEKPPKPEKSGKGRGQDPNKTTGQERAAEVRQNTKVEREDSGEETPSPEQGQRQG